MKKSLILTVSLALSLISFPVTSYASSLDERITVSQYTLEQKQPTKIYKPTRKKAQKIYHNAHEQVDMTYQDLIFKELQIYENSNPLATEDEVNDYFMKLANKYRSNHKNTTNLNTTSSSTLASDPLYDYVRGSVSLNPQEEALFDSNPSKGFKAIVAGKEAQDFTIHKFGYNGHNDKSDAFRHVAWNIWIMGFVDYDWAYAWTTAHEEGAVNQPALEKEMDLNNNSVGRIYGVLNNIHGKSTVVFTQSVIISAYKSGDLKRFWSTGGGFELRTFTGVDNDFIN